VTLKAVLKTVLNIRTDYECLSYSATKDPREDSQESRDPPREEEERRRSSEIYAKEYSDDAGAVHAQIATATSRARRSLPFTCTRRLASRILDIGTH